MQLLSEVFVSRISLVRMYASGEGVYLETLKAAFWYVAFVPCNV